ncbi:hypothetical protein K469DRAFT_210409 [Zopfia rhizophila CBS 207.26]|uniref:Uncharacterized protein n=1 Tax=Zopfia rhizophila CBS 207.26 TaxID=1314779 RepID=A0A6A6DW93_9PEZI|nr:hypothetical protein K469DRAFT_210409 [Zopfia rhizophila CBS 207.26]
MQTQIQSPLPRFGPMKDIASRASTFLSIAATSTRSILHQYISSRVGYRAGLNKIRGDHKARLDRL